MRDERADGAEREGYECERQATPPADDEVVAARPLADADGEEQEGGKRGHDTDDPRRQAPPSARSSRALLAVAQPQRDVGGPHRLGDDGLEVGAQRAEVDLVAQPRAERLDGPRGVVAAAEEAAVHRLLDAAATGRNRAATARVDAATASPEPWVRPLSASCSSSTLPTYTPARVAVSEP